MPTVFDVAKYFLDKLGPMSAMKLQKLCFYAQAWTLAWDEVELFPEEFEAWTDGPVCPELFQRHRGDFMIDGDRLPDGDPRAFSRPQTNNLESVAREYGDRDAEWLRERTHSEDPWIIARGGMSPNERGHEVSQLQNRQVLQFAGGEGCARPKQALAQPTENKCDTRPSQSQRMAGSRRAAGVLQEAQVISKESMRLYYGGFLPDEEVMVVSRRIMAENSESYRVLAQ